MLEKQLSRLLATYLSRFVCGVSEDKLRVSLWSGHVTLLDVYLQPDILEQITALFLDDQHADSGAGDDMISSVGDRDKNSENSSSKASTTAHPKLCSSSSTASCACEYADCDACRPQDASSSAAPAPPVDATVIEGRIRKMVIHIPWTALDHEAVVIKAEGVEIVLGPFRSKFSAARKSHHTDRDSCSGDEYINEKPDGDSSSHDKCKHSYACTREERGKEMSTTCTRRYLRQQREGLARFEQLRHTHGRSRDNVCAQPSQTTLVKSQLCSASSALAKTIVDNEASTRPRSFTEELMDRITNNISLFLSDISLRYEMCYSGLHPSLCAAVVVWMESVRVRTTDAQYVPHFVTGTASPVCRSISLIGLCVSVHAGWNGGAEDEYEVAPARTSPTSVDSAYCEEAVLSSSATHPASRTPHHTRAMDSRRDDSSSRCRHACSSSSSSCHEVAGPKRVLEKASLASNAESFPGPRPHAPPAFTSTQPDSKATDYESFAARWRCSERLLDIPSLTCRVGVHETVDPRLAATVALPGSTQPVSSALPATQLRGELGADTASPNSLDSTVMLGTLPLPTVVSTIHPTFSVVEVDVQLGATAAVNSLAATVCTLSCGSLMTLLTIAQTIQCGARYARYRPYYGILFGVQNDLHARVREAATATGTTQGMQCRRGDDTAQKRCMLMARRRWHFALACVMTDVWVQQRRRQQRRCRCACRLNEGHVRDSRAQAAPIAPQSSLRCPCHVSSCYFCPDDVRGDNCIVDMVQFATRRRVYVPLWKRHCKPSWLPRLDPQEEQTMRQVEAQLTLPQAVFLRCWAYAELCVDQAAQEQQKWLLTQIKKQKMQQQQQHQRPWPVMHAQHDAASTSTMSVNGERPVSWLSRGAQNVLGWLSPSRPKNAPTVANSVDASEATPCLPPTLSFPAASNASDASHYRSSSCSSNVSAQTAPAVTVSAADDDIAADESQGTHEGVAVPHFSDTLEAEWAVGRQFLADLCVARTSTVVSPLACTSDSGSADGHVYGELTDVPVFVLPTISGVAESETNAAAESRSQPTRCTAPEDRNRRANEAVLLNQADPSRTVALRLTCAVLLVSLHLPEGNVHAPQTLCDAWATVPTAAAASSAGASRTTTTATANTSRTSMVPRPLLGLQLQDIEFNMSPTMYMTVSSGDTNSYCDGAVIDAQQQPPNVENGSIAKRPTIDQNEYNPSACSGHSNIYTQKEARDCRVGQVTYSLHVRHAMADAKGVFASPLLRSCGMPALPAAPVHTTSFAHSSLQQQSNTAKAAVAQNSINNNRPSRGNWLTMLHTVVQDHGSRSTVELSTTHLFARPPHELDLWLRSVTSVIDCVNRGLQHTHDENDSSDSSRSAASSPQHTHSHRVSASVPCEREVDILLDGVSVVMPLFTHAGSLDETGRATAVLPGVRAKPYVDCFYCAWLQGEESTCGITPAQAVANQVTQTLECKSNSNNVSIASYTKTMACPSSKVCTEQKSYNSACRTSQASLTRTSAPHATDDETYLILTVPVIHICTQRLFPDSEELTSQQQLLSLQNGLWCLSRSPEEAHWRTPRDETGTDEQERMGEPTRATLTLTQAEQMSANRYTRTYTSACKTARNDANSNNSNNVNNSSNDTNGGNNCSHVCVMRDMCARDTWHVYMGAAEHTEGGAAPWHSVRLCWARRSIGIVCASAPNPPSPTHTPTASTAPSQTCACASRADNSSSEKAQSKNNSHGEHDNISNRYEDDEHNGGVLDHWDDWLVREMVSLSAVESWVCATWAEVSVRNSLEVTLDAPVIKSIQRMLNATPTSDDACTPRVSEEANDAYTDEETVQTRCEQHDVMSETRHAKTAENELSFQPNVRPGWHVESYFGLAVDLARVVLRSEDGTEVMVLEIMPNTHSATSSATISDKSNSSRASANKPPLASPYNGTHRTRNSSPSNVFTAVCMPAEFTPTGSAPTAASYVPYDEPSQASFDTNEREVTGRVRLWGSAHRTHGAIRAHVLTKRTATARAARNGEELHDDSVAPRACLRGCEVSLVIADVSATTPAGQVACALEKVSLQLWLPESSPDAYGLAAACYRACVDEASSNDDAGTAATAIRLCVARVSLQLTEECLLCAQMIVSMAGLFTRSVTESNRISRDDGRNRENVRLGASTMRTNCTPACAGYGRDFRPSLVPQNDTGKVRTTTQAPYASSVNNSDDNNTRSVARDHVGQPTRNCSGRGTNATRIDILLPSVTLWLALSTVVRAASGENDGAKGDAAHTAAVLTEDDDKDASSSSAGNTAASPVRAISVTLEPLNARMRWGGSNTEQAEWECHVSAHIAHAERIEEDIGAELLTTHYALIGPMLRSWHGGVIGSPVLEVTLRGKESVLQRRRMTCERESDPKVKDKGETRDGSVKVSELHCDVLVEGGYACIYVPFLRDWITAATATSPSSPVAKPAHKASTPTTSLGSSLSSSPTAQSVQDSTSATTALRWTVRDVAVLLATDAERPVDVRDQSTFFYLHIHRVAGTHEPPRPYQQECYMDGSVPHSTQLRVRVEQISYLCHSTAKLIPLLRDVCVRVHSRRGVRVDVAEVHVALTACQWQAVRHVLQDNVLAQSIREVGAGDVHHLDVVESQTVTLPSLNGCSTDEHVVQSDLAKAVAHAQSQSTESQCTEEADEECLSWRVRIRRIRVPLWSVPMPVSSVVERKSERDGAGVVAIWHDGCTVHGVGAQRVRVALRELVVCRETAYEATTPCGNDASAQPNEPASAATLSSPPSLAMHTVHRDTNSAKDMHTMQWDNSCLLVKVPLCVFTYTSTSGAEHAKRLGEGGSLTATVSHTHVDMGNVVQYWRQHSLPSEESVPCTNADPAATSSMRTRTAPATCADGMAHTQGNTAAVPDSTSAGVNEENYPRGSFCANHASTGTGEHEHTADGAETDTSPIRSMLATWPSWVLQVRLQATRVRVWGDNTSGAIASRVGCELYLPYLHASRRPVRRTRSAGRTHAEEHKDEDAGYATDASMTGPGTAVTWRLCIGDSTRVSMLACRHVHPRRASVLGHLLSFSPMPSCSRKRSDRVLPPRACTTGVCVHLRYACVGTPKDQLDAELRMTSRLSIVLTPTPWLAVTHRLAQLPGDGRLCACWLRHDESVPWWYVDCAAVRVSMRMSCTRARGCVLVREVRVLQRCTDGASHCETKGHDEVGSHSHTKDAHRCCMCASHDCPDGGAMHWMDEKEQRTDEDTRGRGCDGDGDRASPAFVLRKIVCRGQLKRSLRNDRVRARVLTRVVSRLVTLGARLEATGVLRANTLPTRNSRNDADAPSTNDAAARLHELLSRAANTTQEERGMERTDNGHCGTNAGLWWGLWPIKWQEAWLSSLSCRCDGESIWHNPSSTPLRVCWIDTPHPVYAPTSNATGDVWRQRRVHSTHVRVVLSVSTLVVSVTQLQRVVQTVHKLQSLAQLLGDAMGCHRQYTDRLHPDEQRQMQPGDEEEEWNLSLHDTRAELLDSSGAFASPFPGSAFVSREVLFTAPSMRCVLVSSLHRPELAVHVDCVALAVRERRGGVVANPAEDSAVSRKWHEMSAEATAEVSVFDYYPHPHTSRWNSVARRVLCAAPEVRLRWPSCDVGNRPADVVHADRPRKPTSHNSMSNDSLHGNVLTDNHNTRETVHGSDVSGNDNTNAECSNVADVVHSPTAHEVAEDGRSSELAGVSLTIVCASLATTLPITALTRLQRLLADDWALVARQGSQRPLWLVHNMLGVPLTKSSVRSSNTSRGSKLGGQKRICGERRTMHTGRGGCASETQRAALPSLALVARLHKEGDGALAKDGIECCGAAATSYQSRLRKRAVRPNSVVCRSTVRLSPSRLYNRHVVRRGKHHNRAFSFSSASWAPQLCSPLRALLRSGLSTMHCMIGRNGGNKDCITTFMDGDCPTGGVLDAMVLRVHHDVGAVRITSAVRIRNALGYAVVQLGGCAATAPPSNTTCESAAFVRCCAPSDSNCSLHNIVHHNNDGEDCHETRGDVSLRNEEHATCGGLVLSPGECAYAPWPILRHAPLSLQVGLSCRTQLGHTSRLSLLSMLEGFLIAAERRDEPDLATSYLNATLGEEKSDMGTRSKNNHNSNNHSSSSSSSSSDGGRGRAMAMWCNTHWENDNNTLQLPWRLSSGSNTRVVMMRLHRHRRSDGPSMCFDSAPLCHSRRACSHESTDVSGESGTVASVGRPDLIEASMTVCAAVTVWNWTGMPVSCCVSLISLGDTNSDGHTAAAAVADAVRRDDVNMNDTVAVHGMGDHVAVVEEKEWIAGDGGQYDWLPTSQQVHTLTQEKAWPHLRMRLRLHTQTVLSTHTALPLPHYDIKASSPASVSAPTRSVLVPLYGAAETLSRRAVVLMAVRPGVFALRVAAQLRNELPLPVRLWSRQRHPLSGYCDDAVADGGGGGGGGGAVLQSGECRSLFYYPEIVAREEENGSSCDSTHATKDYHTGNSTRASNDDVRRNAEEEVKWDMRAPTLCISLGGIDALRSEPFACAAPSESHFTPILLRSVEGDVTHFCAARMTWQEMRAHKHAMSPVDQYSSLNAATTPASVMQSTKVACHLHSPTSRCLRCSASSVSVCAAEDEDEYGVIDQTVSQLVVAFIPVWGVYNSHAVLPLWVSGPMWERGGSSSSHYCNYSNNNNVVGAEETRTTTTSPSISSSSSTKRHRRVLTVVAPGQFSPLCSFVGIAASTEPEVCFCFGHPQLFAWTAPVRLDRLTTRDPASAPLMLRHRLYGHDSTEDDMSDGMLPYTAHDSHRDPRDRRHDDNGRIATDSEDPNRTTHASSRASDGVGEGTGMQRMHEDWSSIAMRWLPDTLRHCLHPTDEAAAAPPHIPTPPSKSSSSTSSLASSFSIAAVAKSVARLVTALQASQVKLWSSLRVPPRHGESVYDEYFAVLALSRAEPCHAGDAMLRGVVRVTLSHVAPVLVSNETDAVVVQVGQWRGRGGGAVTRSGSGHRGMRLWTESALGMYVVPPLCQSVMCDDVLEHDTRYVVEDCATGLTGAGNEEDASRSASSTGSSEIGRGGEGDGATSGAVARTRCWAAVCLDMMLDMTLLFPSGFAVRVPNGVRVSERFGSIIRPRPSADVAPLRRWMVTSEAEGGARRRWVIELRHATSRRRDDARLDALFELRVRSGEEGADRDTQPCIDDEGARYAAKRCDGRCVWRISCHIREWRTSVMAVCVSQQAPLSLTNTPLGATATARDGAGHVGGYAGRSTATEGAPVGHGGNTGEHSEGRALGECASNTAEAAAAAGGVSRECAGDACTTRDTDTPSHSRRGAAAALRQYVQQLQLWHHLTATERLCTTLLLTDLRAAVTRLRATPPHTPRGIDGWDVALHARHGEVHDNTTSEPVYPVCVYLTDTAQDETDTPAGEEHGSRHVHTTRPTHETRVTTPLCVSLRLRLWQQDTAMCDTERAFGRVVLEALEVCVGMVVVRLHDDFLAVVRDVVTGMRDAQRAAARVSRNAARPVCSPASPHTPVLQSFAAHPRWYVYNLDGVCLSAIPIQLTLRRRDDGAYDPFRELLGRASAMLPSMEGAALTLSPVRLKPRSHGKGNTKSNGGHVGAPCTNAFGSYPHYDDLVSSDSAAGVIWHVLWPHYRAQLPRQLYRLLGSVDWLSNPRTLLHRWGGGAWQSLVQRTVGPEQTTKPPRGWRSFLRQRTQVTLQSVTRLPWSATGRSASKTVSRARPLTELLPCSDMPAHGAGVVQGAAQQRSRAQWCARAVCRLLRHVSMTPLLYAMTLRAVGQNECTHDDRAEAVGRDDDDDDDANDVMRAVCGLTLMVRYTALRDVGPRVCSELSERGCSEVLRYVAVAEELERLAQRHGRGGSAMTRERVSQPTEAGVQEMWQEIQSLWDDLARLIHA